MSKVKMLDVTLKIYILGFLDLRKCPLPLDLHQSTNTLIKKGLSIQLEIVIVLKDWHTNLVRLRCQNHLFCAHLCNQHRHRNSKQVRTMANILFWFIKAVFGGIWTKGGLSIVCCSWWCQNHHKSTPVLLKHFGAINKSIP